MAYRDDSTAIGCGCGCLSTVLAIVVVALFPWLVPLALVLIPIVVWLTRRISAYRRSDSVAAVAAPPSSPSPLRRVDATTAPEVGGLPPRESFAAPSGGMDRAVEAFYRAKGIWPTDFHCPHFAVCSAGESRFTVAKASFIGPEYERGTVPRLLFLSLDSGDGSRDPNRHTLEAVRQTELQTNVRKLVKTQHWYLTHQLACELLRHFDPKLKVWNTTPYFAHVNTAKCSVNNPHRREAPARLPAHCRAFLVGELPLLMPDILVTQGAKARDAVRDQFRVTHMHEQRIDRATTGWGIVHGVNSRGTLWLSTLHPSAYRWFWTEQKAHWPIYAQKVREFVESRTLKLDGA